MALEFDHLFICTDVGAGAADRLISFGLVEGTSNTHPGQGTANRRFFFCNAMLELLWVNNTEEVQSDLIRPTRLWERWINRKNGTCPFGIALRSGTSGDNTVMFSSWAYHPPYLPATMSIAVGTNSDVLTEPMLFQIPFGKRPDQYSIEKAQPLQHPIGWREMTRIELVSPTANHLSPELQAVIDTNQIKIRVGAAYGIELGFDGERQGRHVDFHPELPLLIRW